MMSRCESPANIDALRAIRTTNTPDILCLPLALTFLPLALASDGRCCHRHLHVPPLPLYFHRCHAISSLECLSRSRPSRPHSLVEACRCPPCCRSNDTDVYSSARATPSPRLTAGVAAPRHLQAMNYLHVWPSPRGFGRVHCIYGQFQSSPVLPCLFFQLPTCFSSPCPPNCVFSPGAGLQPTRVTCFLEFLDAFLYVLFVS